MSLLLWLLAPAMAQEEACGEVYTHDAMATHLAAIDESLSTGDLNQARNQILDAHRGLHCMEQIVHPAYVAHLARQLSITFFFDQDPDAQRRWGHASQVADPTLAWPSDVGPDHPIREVLGEAPKVMPHESNKALVPPKNGAYFMNGRPLTEAKAPVETPGFVQVTDKKGTIIARFWQDGPRFPTDWLGEPVDIKTPKWFTPSTAKSTMRDPLFGETPAVAAAEPAPAPPPPAPAPPPPSEDAAPAVASVPSYVDPFEEARLRAIARETSVRTEVIGTVERTVSTEITTFVEDVGTRGPVLARDYAEWVAYRPQWKRDRAVAADQADDNYLKDWVDGHPPAGAAPVTWVSFAAALAYCEDWGGGMADAAQTGNTMTEWRLADDKAARRLADGQIELWSGDKRVTDGSVGFRCKQ